MSGAKPRREHPVLAPTSALQSPAPRVDTSGAPHQGQRPDAEDESAAALPPPPAAAAVLDTLRRALGPQLDLLLRVADRADAIGLHVFLVGGPVRDALLNRPVQDLDLLVHGEGGAARLGAALAAHEGGDHVSFPAFLTAKWRPAAGGVLDLATARAESYPAPGALPRVWAARVEDDLIRRDFSVNAMAIALNRGQRGALWDPHGGWPDLHRRWLRALHDGSWQDDPTRALRAARFCERFGLELAPDTRPQLQTLRHNDALQHLGPERFGHELDRIFREPAPERVLQRLADWGLLGAISPLLSWEPRDRLALRHALDDAALRGVAPRLAAWLWLAAALPHDERVSQLRRVPGDRHEQRRFAEGPARVDAACEALAAAGADRGRAGRALRGLDAIELVWLGVRLGGDQAASTHARALLAWWWAGGREVRSAVTGDTLLAAGMRPGAHLRPALDAALEEAWRGGDPSAQWSAAARACAGEGPVGITSG